ncbi:MAG TPA: hypothetical protein VFY29_01460, partial [Terriglobia bacterium]|nr:hypothetical protein [Terriglobia bacterium]
KVGGEVRETPMIERNQSIPGIGPAGDFQNQLFSLKEKGDFGPAVSVVGGYAVIMLADKQDPHPAALDEVKERVVNDVKVQKARELAVEKGNQVQEEIKAGKDLRTVARAVGVDVRTSEPLARGGSIAEFGQLIDSEKEIFSSLPIGKAGTPLTSAGKTFAFAVKERHPIDPAEMKKSLSALRAELLDRKREEYFAAYTMDVRKRMEDAREITIDQKALEANTKLTS